MQRSLILSVSRGTVMLLDSINTRIPAFNELPIMSVVHPAYHARPNGGQPSFWPSGKRRLSCDLVLATVKRVRKVCRPQEFGRAQRESHTLSWVCDS